MLVDTAGTDVLPEQASMPNPHWQLKFTDDTRVLTSIPEEFALKEPEMFVAPRSPTEYAPPATGSTVTFATPARPYENSSTKKIGPANVLFCAITQRKPLPSSRAHTCRMRSATEAAVMFDVAVNKTNSSVAVGWWLVVAASVNNPPDEYDMRQTSSVAPWNVIKICSPCPPVSTYQAWEAAATVALGVHAAALTMRSVWSETLVGPTPPLDDHSSVYFTDAELLAHRKSFSRNATCCIVLSRVVNTMRDPGMPAVNS
jgi:hypothetical protein